MPKGPNKQPVALSDAAGLESDHSFQSEAVTEQDLLMYDCVEGNLFPIQNEQLSGDSEQGKNEFTSLFVDTPRPDYYDEPSSGNLTPSDDKSVSNVMTEIGDASGTLTIAPLKRTRPPLKNSSTSRIRIKYDADKSLFAKQNNVEVDPRNHDTPTTPDISTASPIRRPNTIEPVPANAAVKETETAIQTIKTTYDPPADTPWVQRFSNKHKCNYWFNTLDGSSQWSPPADWGPDK